MRFNIEISNQYFSLLARFSHFYAYLSVVSFPRRGKKRLMCIFLRDMQSSWEKEGSMIPKLKGLVTP